MRIADVASLAGLSAATVSRVLNDSDSVRQENRVKVLAAVERLGYRTNKLALNLRRQSAEMIGVVVADIENAHFTQMVRAAEDAAYSRGFRALLCNSDEKAEKQAAHLQILADERASGVILSPSQPAGPEIKTLLDLGIPLVAFDRPVEDPRADAVVANNFEGARAATAHHLAIGHRSICMVSGPESIETGAMRLAGLHRGHARGWACELPSRRLLQDRRRV
ncbi:MAG: LacI family DNA-binding transcriptional regulator [Nocardioidaceae bacterium]